MDYTLRFTTEAAEQLQALESNPQKLKKVRKCLGTLQQNPRHPGLNSHKYSQMQSPHGSPIFESYVENHTPSAWRVFWTYAPEPQTIIIIAITPHP